MLGRKVFHKSSSNLLKVAICNNYSAKQNACFYGVKQMKSTAGFAKVSFNNYSATAVSADGAKIEAAAGDSVIEQEQESEENNKKQKIPKERATPQYVPIMKELSKNCEKILNEQGTKKAFDYFVANHNELQKRFGDYQFNYYSRSCYKDLLTKFLEESGKSNEISVGVQKVLDFAVEKQMAVNYHFMIVADHYLLAGENKAVMSLYATYIEYIKDKPFLSGFFQDSESATTTKSKFRAGSPLFMRFFISYLAHFDTDSLSTEVVKKLFKFDRIPSTETVKIILTQHLKLSPEFVSDCLTKLRKIQLDSVNFNDSEFVKRFVQIAETSSNVNAISNEFESLKNAAKSKSCDIPEFYYTTLMKNYNRLNRSENVLRVWNELCSSLKSSKKVPNIESFNQLLFAVSKTGPYKARLGEIEKVFNRILTLSPKVEPNSNTFVTLIQAYSNIGNFERVKLSYEFALSDEVPSIKSYSALHNAYLQAIARTDIELAYEKCLEMSTDKDSGFEPTIETINTIISCATKTRKFHFITKMLDLAEEKNIKLDVATFTVILNMMFKQAQERHEVVTSSAIMNIFDNMKQNGIRSSMVTYSSIINGLCKDGENLNAGLSIFYFLRDEQKANRSVYVTIIDTLMKNGDYRQAENLFEEYCDVFNKSDVPLYNLMINNFSKSGDLSKALKYFDKIHELGSNKKVQTNKFTYYFILNEALSQNNPDVAKHVYKELTKSNLVDYGTGLPKVIEKFKSEGVFV